MGTKTIHVCDCCGKEFKGTYDRYKIDRVVLKTNNYIDSAGDRDYNSIYIELCTDCANRLVESLEKIVKNKHN